MLCFYIRGDKHSDMCAFHKRSRSQYFFVALLWLVGLLTFLQWRCLISHNHRSFSSRLGFVDTNIKGWEPGNIEPTAYFIHPTKQTAILTGKFTCRKNPVAKATIVVHSEAQNHEQRLAIRNTWAMDTLTNHNISVVFFLGLSEEEHVNDRVRTENQEFNDVIVENFLDTPQNATLKSVMMLKWVTETCDVMNWIMKVNDDVFVNVPNFAKLLNDTSFPKRGALYGALRSKEPVQRDTYHERFMPKYMYPYQVYPDYLGGAGYLMSVDVAKGLYEKALKTSYIHLEDVFVTGLCAESANIKRSYDFRFYYLEGSSPNHKFDCTVLYQKSLIVHSRHLSPLLMFENFDQYKKCFT
ncbi:beta-1,3-galactosyltransferase 1-like [Planococcus citri]|uniref:beta-1,3-galactosyltransferase 1-like n=1 Tax=Planococcus citri TaxID=170843 RepID=UPI0031F72CC6